MQKAILGLVLLIVLAGAGYYWWSTAQQAEPTVDTAAQNTLVQAEEPQTGVGTWQSILAQGKDVTCEFTTRDAENDVRTEGVVYVAGSRLRGDFTTTQEGQPYDMSIIRDDAYTYTWGTSPEGKMAFKFANATGTTPAATEAASRDPFESDAEVTYSCSSWNVEDERLTPPTEIEFSDMSSMMPASAGAAPGAASAQCGACDSAPAEARAQCRAALGC